MARVNEFEIKRRLHGHISQRHLQNVHQGDVCVNNDSEKSLINESSSHPVSSGINQNGLSHRIAVFLPTQLLGSGLESYSQRHATTVTNHPVNTGHVR